VTVKAKTEVDVKFIYKLFKSGALLFFWQTPKSEACWTGRSYKLHEGLIFTVGAKNDKYFNRGAFDLEQSILIPLSRHGCPSCSNFIMSFYSIRKPAGKNWTSVRLC